MKKTQEEIDVQIKGLEQMKETLPPKSFFGDDNWGKIDAQISVLKGESVPDDYYVDESTEEYVDGDNDIYWAADDAKYWLDGNTDEDLFE